MKKGVFLEANIDKRRLKSVLQIAHLAFEDAAHEAFFRVALDGEFLQTPVFLHSNAGFERFRVDNDFLVRLFLRLDEPLDFSNHFVSGVPDGVDQALRLGLHGDWLELVLLDFGRRLQIGFAISAPSVAAFVRAGPLLIRRRGGLGRQAGRDVFGAFDFVIMPAALENALGLFVARGFGAGLLGGAVRLLVQAAAGTKAHAAAAAPGKISVTHNLIRPPINVDVVQNADGDQRAYHRGPAVTQERQRDARHGH